MDGWPVVPRDVLHALLDPRIRAPQGDPDLVIVRILAKGRKDGAPAAVQVELIDRFGDATGFSAMERTTGWDGALKAIMSAQGRTPRGVHPVELAVSRTDYAAELRKRGISLTETYLP